MEILIGLALGAVLLYFWLIGHWFARVLVFLLLGAVTFVTVAYITQDPKYPTAGVIYGLLAAGLAWPVASLPIYYWRHQAREYLSAVYGVPKDYSDTPLTDSARRHGYS